MNITIMFSTENAAFEDNGFVSELLYVTGQISPKILTEIDHARTCCCDEGTKLFDSNGNSIGVIKATGVRE